MNASDASMLTHISSPEFWIKAWEQTLEGTPYRVHSGYATPGFWDNAAKEYDNNDDDRSKQETLRQIDRIRDRGVDISGARVLDIGCGTGRLAIAFAEAGAEVTATDFSTGMLDKLRAKLDGRSLAVTPMQIDWDAVDIDDHGWRKTFDIVVAHMTPAVRRPSSFMKMLDASRNACLLKGWAGRRTNPMMEELWKIIMGEEMRDRTPDIIYEFNLLYSLGFWPDMFIEELSHSRESDVENVVSHYIEYFSGVADKPAGELADVIRAHAESKAENGVITENTTGRTGTMVWRVA